MQITITPTDPAHPDALTCLRAYYAELAAIFPGGFDPGPLPGDGLDQMRAPLGTFLVAYAGPIPVGCVALRGDGSPVAEVKRLWVAAPYRAQGLATRLMTAVEGMAHAQGITRLVLDTSRHLPKAVAFYHRHGWTEIPRYNDNPYAHHFFEKRLETAAVSGSGKS
jgi:GNAT superfamily N-acetyltransferase